MENSKLNGSEFKAVAFPVLLCEKSTTETVFLDREEKWFISVTHAVNTFETKSHT